MYIYLTLTNVVFELGIEPATPPAITDLTLTNVVFEYNILLNFIKIWCI